MIQTLTVYDIIQKALRVTGVVALGDTIDPLVFQEALMILNGLRAEWALNIRNWKKYDKTFSAISNKQSITLGSTLTVSGDILERPNSITDVILINGSQTSASSNNYKLQILPYEMYREKMVQGIYAMPQAAYIDYEYPLTNIFFYPGLTAGWSIRVMGNSYMTDYENIGDTLLDPPEYFDALYLGLAQKLAPLYGIDLSVSVQTQAASAIKHIKHHLYSLRNKKLQNQMAGINGINFFSGRSD